MVLRHEIAKVRAVRSLPLEDCRLLIEDADYAIFMLDPDGYVISWNRGAERAKGYNAHEIIGRHFSTFFPPEDVTANKPQLHLMAALEFGRTEDEGWRVRQDGSRFWANVVIRALRDEQGKLRGFGNFTRDLTAKRAAEERFRESERRFHHLVDAVSDYAIYLLDASGHVSTWNKGAQRSKGYTPAEIIGKHFSVFYTPEDVASGKPERVLEQVRRHGRYEEEGWRVRKDGSRFWANVVVTPLVGDDGRVNGFAKVTRDLSERKKADETAIELLREQASRAAAEAAESRIRESEEQFRNLSRRLEIILEGVAEGITVEDRTGKVIFANTTAATLRGFELRDEDGVPLDASDLPAHRVLRGESGEPVTVRVREKASRREHWYLIQATSVTAASGEPELAISVWREVTVERRREREARYLAEATAAFSFTLDDEQILEHVAQIVVTSLADVCSIHLLDGEQLTSAASAYADPANGALADDMDRRFPPRPGRAAGLWRIDVTEHSVLHEEISEEVLAHVTRSPEHREALRAVGLRSAISTPIIIRDKVVGMLSLLSTDLGRRFDSMDLEFSEELAHRTGVAIENARLYKAAQEAAENAEAAAKRAEEANRIKDEFLATVSHEIRTPLNAIVGWAGILRQRKVDAFVSKGIEVIDRNAQAQSKIIEDILDMSRIITGKLRVEPRPTDLVAVIKDAIEVIRPSATAKQIDLEFEEPLEPCLLVGDPERLQQVVWNLLSNAAKFTQERGSIRVTVRQDALKRVLTVTDTGAGIEAELLPFVFDRFKQGDTSATRRIGGIGLGLALVRHIVELHGGSVRAESPGAGAGSTFVVTLPVQAVVPVLPPESRSLPPRPTEDRQPTDALQGLRVLVVDDDADARDMLTALLSESGALVETARSAPEGFEALKRFRPHVLVSDIAMAEEDGYAFVRRIRGLDPQEGGRTPSVALTAYARAEDRSRALAAGFTTHIGKPVKPEDLIAAITNVAPFGRA